MGTRRHTARDTRDARDGRYLSVRQAAGICSVDERQIRRRCACGRIYAIWSCGRWLIPAERFARSRGIRVSHDAGA